MWSKNDTPNIDELMIREQVTSTMPVVMPPVRLNGRIYVDGAMREDGEIASSQAQREGFNKFVLVLTQERGFQKESQRFPPVYRSIFRKYATLVESLLTRWKRKNETREGICALEAEGKALVLVPERIPVDNNTRDSFRLTAAHRMGLSRARRELSSLREFLAARR